MSKHNKNKKYFPSLSIAPVVIASQLIVSCNRHADMQMHSEDATHTTAANQDANIKLREEACAIFKSACEAIRDQNNATLKKILETHPDLINKVNSIAESYIKVEGKPYLVDMFSIESQLNKLSNPYSAPLDLLYLAVNANNEEAFNLMLSQDIRLMYRSRALIHAIEWNRTNMVTVLLEKKADPNIKLVTLNKEVCYTPIYMAAKVQSKEICQILLNYRANPNNAENKYNITPVHVTTKVGETELTQLLLAHGADPNAKTLSKVSPLVNAMQSNNLALMAVLLNAKADPSERSFVLEDRTLLYWAVKSNNLAQAILLVNAGADIFNNTNPSFVRNETLVNRAVRNNNPEMIDLLLKEGDPIAVKLINDSLLCKAAGSGSLKMVEVLLKKGGDPNVTSTSGKTPLIEAVKSGNEQIIHVLLEAGANPAIRGFEGNTLLHIAAASHNKQLLAFLLDRLDATVTARLINQRNKQGQTPLHTFITSSNKTTNQDINKDSNILDLLIKHGANIHDTYKHQTPFYMAVYRFNEGLADVAFKFLEIYTKANLNIEEGLVQFTKGKVMSSCGMTSTCVKKQAEINRLLAFKDAITLHNAPERNIFRKIPPVTDKKITLYHYLIHKEWPAYRISKILEAEKPWYADHLARNNHFTVQEIADLDSIKMTQENRLLLADCPAIMIMPFSMVSPMEFIDRFNVILEQLSELSNDAYKYRNIEPTFMSSLMRYLSSYVSKHPKEQWRVDMCVLATLRYCHNHKQEITWPMSDDLKRIHQHYDERFKDPQSLTPYENDFYLAFNHYWNQVMHPQDAYNQQVAEHCLSDTVAPSQGGFIQGVHNALGESLFEQVCNRIRALDR